MAFNRPTPAARSTPYATVPRSRSLTGGGTEGNERLTAASGALLLVLLAVLGITIVQMRQLLWLHLFLGMLLIPPVMLKLGTTGYRFTRYYTSDPAYRRKGAPELALRLLAPLVVLTTAVVFSTGAALLFVGPASRGTLLQIHKVSFFAWLAATAVHVLGHLPGMPAVLRADYSHEASELSSDVTGRAGRMLALAGALVAGIVLAVVLIPEFHAWQQWLSLEHGHGN
jgi:hypothetical protein